VNRTVGVTVSAVFVFIGSGLTLLFVAFACVGLWAIWSGASGSEMAEQPPFVKQFMLFSVGLVLGAAAWGIASGVGLLRLREWARVSMLVFSALLALFCLGSILFVWFLPLPPNPEIPAQQMRFIHFGLTLFYGLFAAVGVGWLYFFNTNSVKEQFRQRITPDGLVLHPLTRPVSITVVAWFLLVLGAISPIELLIPFPVIIFGVVFTGHASRIVLMIYCVIELLAGVGLLKLKLWARGLAAGFFDRHRKYARFSPASRQGRPNGKSAREYGVFV
jgi:hypothetical protein